MQWGLAHRKLESVQSIGVEEIHWGKGHGADRFLTVIYQIDGHRRRLLQVLYLGGRFSGLLVLAGDAQPN